MIDPTINLINETHHSCEKREYVLIVLKEYTIIYPILIYLPILIHVRRRIHIYSTPGIHNNLSDSYISSYTYIVYRTF